MATRRGAQRQTGCFPSLTGIVVRKAPPRVGGVAEVRVPGTHPRVYKVLGRVEETITLEKRIHEVRTLLRHLAIRRRPAEPTCGARRDTSRRGQAVIFSSIGNRSRPACTTHR